MDPAASFQKHAAEKIENNSPHTPSAFKNRNDKEVVNYMPVAPSNAPNATIYIPANCGRQ